MVHPLSARPASRAGLAIAWRTIPALQPAPPPPAEPSRDAALATLEGVLFLAQQPLNSRRLAELAGLADGTKARTLLRSLGRLHDAEGSAFRVEEVAGGFQLLTRPMFAPWLRRCAAAGTEIRLSAPALETLAVVAYRQPVLRTEIESIRGVQCDEVLRQLIERGLVRVAGRSSDLGRPLLYGTTRRFLQVFGLRHLDELPRVEVFSLPTQESQPPLADIQPERKAIGGFSSVEENEMSLVLHRYANKAAREEPKLTASLLRNAKDDDVPADGGEEEEFEDEEDFDDDDEDLDEDLDDDDEDLDEDFDDDDDDTWEEVEDDEDDDWDDDEDDDWDDDEDEDWEEDEKEDAGGEE